MTENRRERQADNGRVGRSPRVRLSFYIRLACMAVFAAALLFVAARRVFPQKYSAFVESASDEFSLEKCEIYAVIMAESGFDSDAESPAGARGLMQLMPSTARFCAEMLSVGYSDGDEFEPSRNIRLGCCYLAYLKQRFEGGDVYAAYNAGEYRVRQWLESGTGIEYKETADYVKRVSAYKKIYRLLYGE